MTATTVTPEIIRVAFLRRIAKSLRFSLGLKALIISALEGIRSSLSLAATWVLMRHASLCVGDGRSIRASMISRTALTMFKV
jgi:hypothetical protein